MSSFEFNKIFAAVLVAAIVAMLGGFIAKQAVHPEKLVNDAVAIDGAADAGDHGGTKAEDKGPEPILALLAAADVEKGAKVSKACAACHSFEKGSAAKQGPSLWNIVNHDIGAAPGFQYSEGMKNLAGNWDYAHLNQFLTKPKKLIADTKMNYVGLKKPEDRAAIIAWLRTLSDSPAPLPTEAEIAAETAAHAPPAEEAPAPADGAAPTEGTAPAEGAAPPADATAPAEPVKEGAAQNDTAPHAGTESPDSSGGQTAPESAPEAGMPPPPATPGQPAQPPSAKPLETPAH